MKKISIVLNEDLLEIIDCMSISYKNRSEFIEIVLQKALSQMIRDKQNARDLELINKYADELNAEAEDVLSYQVFFENE